MITKHKLYQSVRNEKYSVRATLLFLLYTISNQQLLPTAEYCYPLTCCNDKYSNGKQFLVKAIDYKLWYMFYVGLFFLPQ